MATEAEQSEIKKRKFSRRGCAVWGLLIFPLVYFLSYPIACCFLGVWGVTLNPVTSKLYFPVHWLVTHVKIVDVFYEWIFSVLPEKWWNY